MLPFSLLAEVQVDGILGGGQTLVTKMGKGKLEEKRFTTSSIPDADISGLCEQFTCFFDGFTAMVKS